MKLFITCIAWVESILSKEIERLGYKNLKSSDRYIYAETDDAGIARVNLWSRVGNKVYIEITKWRVEDFDDLFDIVHSVNWGKYCSWDNPIHTNWVSIKSNLDSIPAIQKITKKAIVTKLTGSKNDILYENADKKPFEILIFIEENECRILLNTSWEALHKRWYKVVEHDAPIKESLAAALVLLSWWSFKKPLYDFFCWSGTILIEAALIARNIAPGSLGRRFSFELFDWYDKKYLESALDEATKKAFHDKKYEIIWSDIDENCVRITLKNAKNAWVDDTITVKQKMVSDYVMESNLSWTLVTNPPYWLRLNESNLDSIYRDISTIFKKNPELNWWLITSYFEFDTMINVKDWKKRKLYNGSEKCYFYKKI